MKSIDRLIEESQRRRAVWPGDIVRINGWQHLYDQIDPKADVQLSEGKPYRPIDPFAETVSDYKSYESITDKKKLQALVISAITYAPHSQVFWCYVLSHESPRIGWTVAGIEDVIMRNCQQRFVFT